MRGERCPQGQETLWVECGEGVEEMEVIKTVKERLNKERDERVANGEENMKESVTVLFNAEDKARMTYPDWT